MDKPLATIGKKWKFPNTIEVLGLWNHREKNWIDDDWEKKYAADT